MTQNELDLLHGFLHDTLEESDFARLQFLLRQDAEARRMLRWLSAVDTGLMQHAAINPQTLRLLSPSHESLANRVLNARRSFSSQFAETGARAQLDQGIALTQEFARRQFDLEDHRREDDRHAIAGGALGALERAAAPVGEILPDDSPLIGRGLHGSTIGPFFRLTRSRPLPISKATVHDAPPPLSRWNGARPLKLRR